MSENFLSSKPNSIPFLVILCIHVYQLFPNFPSVSTCVNVIKMPPKRYHKTLSLTDKNTILKRLDKGESGKASATEFQVGTSTISDIKKKTEPIRR
jgi:hypothetical protein